MDRITTKQLNSKVNNVNATLDFDAFRIGGAYGHTHVEDYAGRDHVHGTKRDAWEFLNAIGEARHFYAEAERRKSQGYTNAETLAFCLIVDNEKTLYDNVCKRSQGDPYQAAEALESWWLSIREAQMLGAKPHVTIDVKWERTLNELAAVGHPSRINWLEIVGAHSEREYLR